MTSDTAPPPQPQNTGLTVLVTIAVLVGGWWFLFGRGDSSPAANPEPTVGRYEQTWDRSYASTTCADWHQRMDRHERFVMAGDILTAARDDGGVPPDRLIRSFAAAIGTACRDGGEGLEVKVTEVATILYVAATEFQP